MATKSRKKQKKYTEENPEPVDIDKYGGEWIAWVDGKIVAHGRDLKQVAEKARKRHKSPIFEQVPTHEVMII